MIVDTCPTCDQIVDEEDMGDEHHPECPHDEAFQGINNACECYCGNVIGEADCECDCKCEELE